MDTAHFLLTRFNVPIGSVPVNLGLNDDWLEHRFALFENFCLPSVLAQENKDFFWVIVMDERTPERWRSRLLADLQPLPGAEALPLKSLTEASVIARIERLTSASSVQRIITTRMDNDDAIAKDYLSTIARRAAALPGQDRSYIINFRHGCQVSDAGFFAVSEWLNPFLSVVSPRHPLITAWHGEHASMKRFGKVIDSGIFAPRHPYWLQAIHGNNVANRLQRKRTRLDPRQLERFCLGEHWRRLLQQEKFAPVQAEVLTVQFPYHLPWAAPASSPSQAREITMSGLKGEFLFENVRRDMTFYKNDLLQFIGFLLRGSAPGLIIDVGANIGNHALFFAKVLGAEVLCVEPNPAAVNLLKSNVALNGLTDRVSVVESAASDAPGSAQLRAGSLLNLGAAAVSLVEGPEAGGIALRTLDDIVAQTGRKDHVVAIKAAVEGYEPRVLRGALQTIRDHLPVIVVEAATESALREIEQTLRPFRYFKAGPFCETNYVFASSRWNLWRALIQRRVFRTTARVKRKLFEG